MRPLLIWGCGGHAREVNLLCQQAGREVAGFLDERPEWRGRRVDDVPVLGDLADVAAMRDQVHVLCAGVGDPALKRRFAERSLALGFRFAEPLIHPQVFVSAKNRIDDGTVLCAGSVMTVNIRIGRHAIINRIVNVGHDCQIGDYATVSPGCNLSGNVRIGEGAFIGTGASLRERVTVGEWSVVAGGAFVHADVPERTMVAGVPARAKKRLG